MTKRESDRSRAFGLLAGVALTSLAATGAIAQTGSAAPSAPTDNSATTSPDIVVTALKRETTAQDTPLAITAVSSGQLRAMNIIDSDSLQRVSPGLVIRESPFSGSRAAIRNIRSAGEPTVGLYYDETPVVGSAGVTADAGGTTPNIRLFDVDRVEVLRGPQGTLYGSSSEAGTIRLIFKKPDTGKVAADVDAKVFGMEGGRMGFETQGMVNLPIARDLLAVRVVGFYQRQPGYIDSLRFNRNDINKSTSRGGRVTVRATPAEGLTIDGLAVYQNTRGFLNDYNLAVGTFKQAYESQEPTRDRFEIFSGTINYLLGPVALTAVGSHAYRNFDYAYDTSAFDRFLALRFAPTSPQAIAFNALAPSVAESPQVTKTDTAEARIATRGTGPLQLTAGFFYSNRKGDFISNIRRTSPLTGELLPLTTANLEGQRIIRDELKQTAEFVEGSFDLTSQLSVTGGVRHYHYDRRVYGLVTVPNAFLSLAAGPATDQKSSEEGWLYKANVSFKIARHVLAYATYSTGERPGGVNQTLGLPAALQSYGSDRVRNYEIGFKSELFDRRLTFNADVFRIDWDNIQTSGTLPSTPFVFIANSSKARVRGVEADSTLRLIPGLVVQLSGSYINGHLTANQTTPGIIAPGLNGDPVPGVPRWTVQPSIQYSAPLNAGLKAVLRADGYYQSSSWINYRRLNALYEQLPAYATLSLRAGVSDAADSWNASIYANNVTNNHSPVAKFGNTSTVFGNQPRAISLTPRTIGIELFRHF